MAIFRKIAKSGGGTLIWLSNHFVLDMLKIFCKTSGQLKFHVYIVDSTPIKIELSCWMILTSAKSWCYWTDDVQYPEIPKVLTRFPVKNQPLISVLPIFHLSENLTFNLTWSFFLKTWCVTAEESHYKRFGCRASNLRIFLRQKFNFIKKVVVKKLTGQVKVYDMTYFLCRCFRRCGKKRSKIPSKKPKNQTFRHVSSGIFRNVLNTLWCWSTVKGMSLKAAFSPVKICCN